MSTAARLATAGEIGGRTVQIAEAGTVETVTYPLAALRDGQVRVRTVCSALSPGTEATFLGRDASNPYLRKRWNDGLRLFEAGEPALDYPVTFGYRAAGVVDESRHPDVPVGQRVYGNWRHTEFTAMPGERALGQGIPADLGWDDAVDIAQMGPIAVNAAATARGGAAGRPAIVFGAGPVGLLTAQVIRADGANPVVVVDRSSGRLAIAEGLGLETQLAAPGTDVARVLKERLGSDAIPIAWECTGSTQALGEAIRVVRRRGTVIAVGFYQGGAAALQLADEFHHNAVAIVTAQIGNPIPPYDRALLQARTLQLIRGGALVAGGLPRLTVPVDRAADGFAALDRPDEVLQVALSYPSAAGALSEVE